MRRVLRLAQARAGLSNEVRDTRCRKSRCVRIHRAIPQPEDAAKTRQAGSEVLNPFTTVRDFGVEPPSLDQDQFNVPIDFTQSRPDCPATTFCGMIEIVMSFL